MSTSKKTEAADRHHGGPGSSHQREDRPDPTKHGGSQHGEATSAGKSETGRDGRGKDDHGEDGKGRND